MEGSRRRGGGGARCPPERFYCLPMGLTRDEVLQSQTGLSQCVCMCVYVWANGLHRYADKMPVTVMYIVTF